MKGFIHGKVLSRTRLAPGSDGFELWTNPPVKTRRVYRLFDIINHNDVMTKSSNPKLQIRETHPLTYKISIKKNDIQWLENDRRIKCSIERIFHREGEFDEMSLNEHGAFIDIPRAMFRTKFERTATDAFYSLGGNNAFNYSKAIDKLEGFISPLFAAISARMQGPNRDKYGFIYRYNGSNGFNFTIETGVDDPTIKGKVVNFASEYTDFQTTADRWQNEFFDGLTYPPMGNPPNRQVINLFQPDFCRPIQLRYNRTVSMFGIEQVYEYVLKLINTDTCPQMDETCPEVDRVDITRCFSSELPPDTLLLTKPHLYGHNSSWTNVDFVPNGEQHESTVYFEPLTGTPLMAQSRIQLNINTWIDRITVREDGTSEPTRARSVSRFIPMMWIDQLVTLNDATLSRLKMASVSLEIGHQVHGWVKLVYLIVALFCAIGLIFLLELFLWNRRQKHNRGFLFKSNNEQEKALLNQTLTMSPTSA